MTTEMVDNMLKLKMGAWFLLGVYLECRSHGSDYRDFSLSLIKIAATMVENMLKLMID